MKKFVKLFTLFLTLAVVAVQIFAQPAFAAFESEVQLEVFTQKDGNIFYSPDEAAVFAKLFNKSASEKQVLLSYTVCDFQKNTVFENSLTVDLKPNTAAEKSLPLCQNSAEQNLSEGTYNISITADGGEAKKLEFCITSGENKNSNLGICTHFAFNSGVVSTDDVSAAKAAGISWIRDECWWNDTEKSVGKLEIPKFVKDYVDFANQNDIKVLMVLSYTNSNYCDLITDGDYKGKYAMPHTDEQIAAYAAYCGYVAGQLKGKVDYFEIWNEPENLNFNPDRDNTGTVQNYAKLMHAAYDAIKAANPNAFVLGCSSAGAYQSKWWIEKLLACSDAKYMDGFSYHPYTWVSSPLDETTRTFEYETDYIKSALKANGMEDKPLWITEIGYSTGENWYSETQQAAYNIRTQVLNLVDGRVDKMFMYELKDSDSYYKKFGYISADGTYRSSVFATAFLNSILKDAAFCEQAVLRSQKQIVPETKLDVKDDGKRFGGYSVYRFKTAQNNKEVFVLWAKYGSEYNVSFEAKGDSLSAVVSGESLTVDLSAANKGKSLKLFDMMGNPIEGSFAKLGLEPVYAVCEPKVQVGEADFEIETEKNKVKILGSAGKSCAKVALKVADKKGDAVYFDQTEADETGKFCFDFALLQNGDYDVFLCNGESLEKSGLSVGIKITLFKNGESVSALSGLKANDKIKALATLDDAEIKGRLIGGVYSGNVLDFAVCDDIEKAEDVGCAEVEFSINSDGETVKIFLFDENLKPLTEVTK